MPRTDREAFLSVSNETGQHIIVRGRVATATGPHCTAHFETPDVSLEPGMEALLLFDQAGVVMQETVLIDQVEEDGRLAHIEITRQGDAVPYEQQRGYRLRVRDPALAMELDDRIDLELIDISSRGLAFRADQGFEIGRSLEIALSHGQCRHRGRGIVRSTRRLADGTVRCGVECVDDRSGRPLREALTRAFRDLQWAEFRQRSEIR